MSEIWVEFFDKLPAACMLTIFLCLTGYVAGQTIALFFGAALHLSSGLTYRLLSIYPYVFRGTPLLIQLFLLYYGLAQLAWIRESFLWPLVRDPVGCAFLALAFNTGAYSTELVRSALANLPRGQREAAAALGFGKVKTLLLVELSQAYRFLIPSLSNEIIFVLKGSALASTITLIELTGLSKIFIAKTFSPFEFFAAAGAVYLIIGFVFVRMFRMAAKLFPVR